MIDGWEEVLFLGGCYDAQRIVLEQGRNTFRVLCPTADTPTRFVVDETERPKWDLAVHDYVRIPMAAGRVKHSVFVWHCIDPENRVAFVLGRLVDLAMEAAKTRR